MSPGEDDLLGCSVVGLRPVLRPVLRPGLRPGQSRARGGGARLGGQKGERCCSLLGRGWTLLLPPRAGSTASADADSRASQSTESTLSVTQHEFFLNVKFVSLHQRHEVINSTQFNSLLQQLNSP